LDSDIEEKRQILKNILHKIYANMVSKRKMIRKVSTRFLKYNNFCGTGEILDFFASIIKGFVTPLNEEKLTFFIEILLPLHKTNCEQYYDKLVKCCINYVEKDETLAIPMIEVILIFYPCSNELKKKLFINELVDLLTIVKIEKYLSFLKKIIPYLQELITKGLSSEALFPYIVKLFSVESFLRIIDHYKKEIFSLVVPIIDSLELDLTKGITLLSQTSIDSVTNQNEWLEKGILIDHIQTIKIRLKYIDEELYLKYTKI
jgi:serine/threonine-protein phosphatase 2A regulatory subunit B'